MDPCRNSSIMGKTKVVRPYCRKAKQICQQNTKELSGDYENTNILKNIFRSSKIKKKSTRAIKESKKTTKKKKEKM